MSRNPYTPPEAPVADVVHTAASRRPGGITWLCVLLTWFGVAGFGNTVVLFRQPVGLLPPWIGVITLAYALTASAAAMGLWRMRRWGLLALRAWMAACLILIGCFVVLFPSRIILGGLWGAVGFTAGFIVMFGYLHGYVQRSIGTAA